MTPSSWLRPPAPEADPRESLRWVRKFEVVGGAGVLLLAVILRDQGALPWVLVVVSLLSFSPWPGAGAILRKAERRPEILASDPARRRARGLRTIQILVPAYAVGGFGVGFLAGGLTIALIVAAAMGAAAVLGGWWYLRGSG
jgi:hypothetical protein